MPTQEFHKLCKKCNTVKPLNTDHFYKHKRDGWSYSCKRCAANEQKERRTSPEGKRYFIAWNQSEKGKQSHLESSKKYWSTEKGKSYLKRAWKRAREKYTQQIKARAFVTGAIRSKKIKRPTHCLKCGVNCKPEAHHYLGYARENWLDIQWLCTPCHKEIDKK